MTPNDIQKLITIAMRRMAEHPRKLEITSVKTAHTLNMSVRCHPGDVSKVIGKSGRNIQAFQRLAQRMGDNLQISTNLIVEVGEQTSEPSFKKFTLNDKYNPEAEIELLGWFGEAIVNDGVKASAVEINAATTMLVLQCEDYDRNLELDLSTVFSAIGKNNGTNLYVELDCV